MNQLYVSYGGLEFLRENLPPTMLHPGGDFTHSQIIAWALFALWTFVDPNFYQSSETKRPTIQISKTNFA